MAPRMSKHADFRKALTDVASSPAFMVPAALSGMALAGNMAGGLVDKLRGMYDQNRSYKSMLEQNQVLRDHADGEMVRKTFQSLYRANPHFMRDPMVAGGLVHQTLDAQDAYGGTSRPMVALARQVADLTQSRVSWGAARKNESGQGVGDRVERYLSPLVPGAVKAVEGLEPERQAREKFRREKEDFESARSRERALADFGKSMEQLREAGMREVDKAKAEAARHREELSTPHYGPSASDPVIAHKRNLPDEGLTNFMSRQNEQEREAKGWHRHSQRGGTNGPAGRG